MKRKQCGVSNIIGTMLLLIIAISAVSLIYFQVLSDDGPPPTTIVKIVGRGEGKYVYLEHTGGETIDLDNSITYSIGGYSFPSTEIGDIIEEDEPPMGVWNLGERLKIPIQYNLDQLEDFESAQITGIDTLSNSIIFYGPVTIPQPTSDLGIDLTIEDLNGPPADGGDSLQVIITLTSFGGDVNGSGNVTVQYDIPDGLLYESSFSPSGHDTPYNNETGIWHAGHVLVGHPAVLKINVTVLESLGRIPTQLGLVLDGSGSIIDYDWNKATDQAHSGSTSAKTSADTQSTYYLHDGRFGSNSLNASGASKITIEFWFRLYDATGTVESGDVILECYDGNSWDQVDTLGGNPSGNWVKYTKDITDNQYFIPNFRIRFNAEDLYEGWSGGDYHDEMIWVDDVLITKDDTIVLLDDGFESDPWDMHWRSDWDMALLGLSNAIKNVSVFPHDGSVEITVVQFGYTQARTEISPTVVDSYAIAEDVADDILAINQRKQGTPMAAGLYLTTDQLLDSDEFNDTDRQAVVMVTDGLPTECASRPFGGLPGPYNGYSCSEANAADSAEDAREDLRTSFDMTDESDTIDEIDVLAVGAGPDIDWLNSSIIWPNPSIWEISTEPFDSPGWVAHIDSFEQFDYAINEMFKALFSLQNTVNYVGSSTFDPNEDNNQATVTIG